MRQRAAIAAEKESTAAALKRVDQMERTRKAQDALPILDEIIAREPKNAKAYGLRGVAHGKLGQIEEALADYEKAIELNPADTPSFDRRWES